MQDFEECFEEECAANCSSIDNNAYSSIGNGYANSSVGHATNSFSSNVGNLQNKGKRKCLQNTDNMELLDMELLTESMRKNNVPKIPSR